MAWGTVTAADVEASLNVGELSDYRKHIVSASDPLPTIIDDVVSMVRGYVAARNALAASGIPPALRAPAIDIIIYRLAKRVLRGGDKDETRKSANDDAVKLLEAVASGKFSVAETADPDIDPSAGGWGSQTRFDSHLA